MTLNAVYISAEREIFKVQLPIITFEGVPRALIYNRDRSIKLLVPVTDELTQRVSGRLKSFFWGNTVGDIFAWGEEAPWQEW